MLADFGSNAAAQAVALQPDGEFVLAGSSGVNRNFDFFALARYEGQ